MRAIGLLLLLVGTKAFADPTSSKLPDPDVTLADEPLVIPTWREARDQVRVAVQRARRPAPPPLTAPSPRLPDPVVVGPRRSTEPIWCGSSQELPRLAR